MFRGLMAALVAVALMAPTAMAQTDYPEPSDPGQSPTRPGKGKQTLKVCKKLTKKAKKRGCRYTSIQKAVDQSKRGDTISVAPGTYKEGVKVLGKARDDLKLIGDRENPERVVLNGTGLKGAAAQNGVLINNADRVEVNGFTIMNYKANGVFAVNVVGYELTNLVAIHTGTYGIYAFNSKGGTMSNSIASENNDAGFYIGQTPKQAKPKRSFVKNVRSHTNVLGFSGTNMRYVTIQDSQFWNNGVGIVPNALDSEKYPPEEFNVIKDNEVFWNNFNYYKGAPFELRETAVGELAYPVGVGILLFGGRDNLVEGNKIYGNYLFGFGMLDQLVLEDETAKTLDRNTIRGNEFGLGGGDLNGRDIGYDGSGSDNCFENNGETQNNVPADNSELVACPFSGSNGVNDDARMQLVAPAVEEDHEKYWIKHPHTPKDGYTPLESYEG